MKTLILVDVQNDFLPGGALAVPEGHLIVPSINQILPSYDLIVATQDWHPANHASFAASHPGRHVFETIDLDGLPQTLWPIHCVQNTGGALFAPGLDTQRICRVFQKGTHSQIDSYSGFHDNGHRAATGMADWLREAGVEQFDVAGLATDYCVKFTVLDGLTEGFKVNVLTELCRGVNLRAGDVESALRAMREAGATLA